MLINRLPTMMKKIVAKQLCSRQMCTALVSCVLLTMCGLLSGILNAQQLSTIDDTNVLRKKPTGLNYMQRDPTRPPSVVVQQLAAQLAVNPDYQLTAIFKRNDQQYAVLNGNIVTTGDPIADMYITKITGSNLTMARASRAQASLNNPLPSTLVLELNGAVNVKKQVTK